MLHNNILLGMVRYFAFYFSCLLRLIASIFHLLMCINLAKIFMIQLKRFSCPNLKSFETKSSPSFSNSKGLLNKIQPNINRKKSYDCVNYSSLKLSISSTSGIKAFFFFCKNCLTFVRGLQTVFSIMCPCVMKALAFPLPSVNHIQLAH